MDNKRIEFSIDKLTILGQFKKANNVYALLKDYLYCAIYSREVMIENDFFDYSCKIGRSIFFQMDRRNKSMRIEFNPNLLNEKEEGIIQFLLSYCHDFHFTRLDLALDLYNYEVYLYNITDIKTRKKAYYYDMLGKLETVYLGALGSNKFVRIYNKAKEQGITDKEVDWWRVELQLRDTYIDRYFANYKTFFDGLLIYKYVGLEKLSFETRANLEYVLGDITRLNHFTSRSAKAKYRKLIANLQTESIHYITDIIYHSKAEVTEYLSDLLNVPVL